MCNDENKNRINYGKSVFLSFHLYSRSATIPDFTDSGTTSGIEPHLITEVPGIENYLITIGSISGAVPESVKLGI